MVSSEESDREGKGKGEQSKKKKEKEKISIVPLNHPAASQFLQLFYFVFLTTSGGRKGKNPPLPDRLLSKRPCPRSFPPSPILSHLSSPLLSSAGSTSLGPNRILFPSLAVPFTRQAILLHSPLHGLRGLFSSLLLLPPSLSLP